MNEEISRWLPLLTAILAGIFALSQIRSNNITNARIKWLENLKQLLTEFLSECMVLQLSEGLKKGLAEKNPNEPVSDSMKTYLNKINESTFDKLKIIESKHNLIKLNLNPKEELHQKLEKLLDHYMKLFNEIPIQTNLDDHNFLGRKMNSYSDTIILLIRYVMKLEWEKTKRPFLSRIFYMSWGKGKELLTEALNLKLIPIKEPKRTQSNSITRNS